MNPNDDLALTTKISEFHEVKRAFPDVFPHRFI